MENRGEVRRIFPVISSYVFRFLHSIIPWVMEKPYVRVSPSPPLR